MRSRRNLIKQALNMTVATVICRVLPKTPLTTPEISYAAVRTFSDITAVAVGKVTPILAKDLIAGREVTGGIDEGSHTHTFKVSAEQMAELKAGKIVKVKSGKGSDGSLGHTVTIDPASLDANGSSIQFFEAENGELIGLRLGDGEEPFLYVEGVEDLDAATVKYCVKSAIECQEEASFIGMQLINSIKGRTIYTSIDRLQVKDGNQVFVWATTQSNKKVKLAVRIGS